MKNIRDSELLIKLGERVKALRKAKQLTQEDLAYASDLELSQIYRIEKGKNNPSITTINAIAKGLEITISDLLNTL